MPKVLAWQCPHTKTFFELDDEQKYRNHLRRQSRLRSKEEELRKYKETIHNARNTLITPKDMGNWIKDNYRELHKYGKSHNRLSSDFKITKVTMYGTYNNRIANRNSAPIGKTTYWHSKLAHYPGIEGKIFINYTGKGFDPDMIRQLSIRPHGGGSGPCRIMHKGHDFLLKDSMAGHKIMFWLDDWPALKKVIDECEHQHQAMEVVQVLAGKTCLTFRYTWGG